MKFTIPAEELGRFLLAYHRHVFEPNSLGQAFNLYYGLHDKFLASVVKDIIAIEYIKSLYIRG